MPTFYDDDLDILEDDLQDDDLDIYEYEFTWDSPADDYIIAHGISGYKLG